MLNFSRHLQKKNNISNLFYFLIIIVGISIYSALYFMSGTQAEVSADGNFTIEPATPGTDDIVGATSTQWTFSVTTTQDLVAGDVVRFYFPTSSLASAFDVSSATTSAISNITLYTSISTTTYEASTLTDGGIESWNTVETPDSWIFESTDLDYTAQSSDRNAGNYALALTSYNNYGDSYLSPSLFQEAINFSNNDSVQFRFYAKRSVGTPNAMVFYRYADALDNEYIYNFTSSTWEALAGPITDDQVETVTLSDTWTQYTTTQVAAPASGVAGVEIAFISIGSLNDVALYDDVEFLVNSANVLTNSNFEAWSTVPTSPSGWAIGSFNGIVKGSLEGETTITHGGNYAVKSTWGWDSAGEVYNYVSTSTAGLQPGDTYQVSVWSRKNDGASTYARLGISLFNGPVSSATQIYDFYNNEWRTYTTGTNPGWNDTGVQEEQRFVTTETYQATTTENFIVPASGNITIALYGRGNKVGDVYDSAYIDDVTLQKAVETSELAGVAYSATSTLLYGIVSSTIPSGTAFSVTFDGITNGQDTQGNVTDLVWQVEAGTPTSLLEPWGSLSETKFAISATESLIVPVPTAPSSLATSTIDTTSIGITWTDASSDETGFVVQKSTDGSSYTTVTTTAANATSTTLTGLTQNTGYYVRVAATNSYGDSSYATMSIQYTLAAPPVSASSSVISATEIDVSWGANDNPSSTVYYITDNLLDTATTTGTSLTYTDLTPNTEYTFEIKAAHNNGTFTSVVTTSAYTIAAIPSAVSASAVSTTSIAVSWSANSNPNGTVFQISGSGFSTVTTTATSTTISSLTPNTSYTISVKAQNNDGSYSSAATDTEYTLSAIPINVSVSTLSATSLSISWDANNNANGTVYSLYGTGLTSATTTDTALIFTGLTPNINYTVNIRAQHNDGTYTDAVTDSAYTSAAVPATVVGTANGQTSIIISWSANSNATGTVFELYNAGTDSSIATTTDTSYTLTGLTAATAYTFKVRALYNSDDTTWSSFSSDSDSVTTASVGNSVAMTLSTGASSTFQFSDGEPHTATLNSVVEGVSANITIASTPVTQSFSSGVATNIDTNENGVNDMTVTVTSITSSGATISLASYTPSATPSTSGGGGGSVAVEASIPILGSTPVTYVVERLSVTSPFRTVVFSFNVQSAYQLTVSDNPTFAGSSWEVYSKEKQIVLDSGETEKTYYVKFRSSNGGETAVQKIEISIPDSVQVPSSTLIDIDRNSLVKMSKINSRNFVQGQNLSFNYVFTNTTGKSLPIKVVRSVVNSSGKTVLVSNGTATLRANGKYSRSIRQNLSTRLAPGIYTKRVVVYDARNGKTIAENSFEFTLEKRKVKQVVWGGEVGNTEKTLVFDTASLKSLKKAVVLPYSFRLKYSFKNTTGISGYFDLAREIVDENGKVWQRNTGRWRSNNNQVRNINILQIIPTELPAGNYMIRIKFSPVGQNMIVGENYIPLTVSER